MTAAAADAPAQLSPLLYGLAGLDCGLDATIIGATLLAGGDPHHHRQDAVWQEFGDSVCFVAAVARARAGAYRCGRV